jgi:outer membrane protein TolC
MRSLPLILLGLGAVSATVATAQSSLTLEEAIELSLARNEQAAIADAQVEAARARVERARAFFFPDFTITGNYTRRAYETIRTIGDEDVTIQSFNAMSGTATLSQTVFDARAFPVYRQVRLLRDSTRLSSAEDKRLLSFEAADAFLSTLSLEQVVTAAERRRKFAQTNLDDARARFEAGLVSSNDVTRAELELATAEREAARARGDVDAGYLQLGNVLNTEVRGPLQVPEQLLETAANATPPGDGGVEQAKTRRLDVAATARIAAAQRAFADEPSRRIIPALGLNGQLRTTNEAGLSGRQNDGFLSLNLSWPLFDGGDREADRAERLALYRAAELELTQLQRRVELQVKSAGVAVTSEQASLKQAIVAVRAARKNAEETSELYRQGLASALEVADASVRLFEAEVAEARARFELALAFLDLRAASGLDPLGREFRL